MNITKGKYGDSRLSILFWGRSSNSHTWLSLSLPRVEGEVLLLRLEFCEFQEVDMMTREERRIVLCGRRKNAGWRQNCLLSSHLSDSERLIILS